MISHFTQVWAKDFEKAYKVHIICSHIGRCPSTISSSCHCPQLPRPDLSSASHCPATTGLTPLHNKPASKPGLWQQPFTLHGSSGCDYGSPLPSSVSSSISWELLRGLPYPHHLKLWPTPSRPPFFCYFSSLASYCLFISIYTSAITVIHKKNLA